MLIGAVPVIFSDDQSVAVSSISNLSHQRPVKNVDREALELGILVSHQEEKYGTNMFDSIRPEDEPEIERLKARGLSVEGAILTIFNRRYKNDPTRSVRIDSQSQSRNRQSGSQYPYNSTRPNASEYLNPSVGLLRQKPPAEERIDFNSRGIPVIRDTNARDYFNINQETSVKSKSSNVSRFLRLLIFSC